MLLLLQGLMAVAAEPASATDATVLTSCVVEELGLTLGVPSSAYVTGQDVTEAFPLLDVYGMTAEQLTEKYKASGICLNAIWYDGDADVTEIVVTATSDQDTRSVFNLNQASDNEMRILEDKYLNYSGKTGAHYDAVSTVEHEQTRFIRAKGAVSGVGSRSNHLQYMTIVNGIKVEITLIEHFGVAQEYTGENVPWSVSPDHERLMERIIASARWSHIRSSFLSRYRSLVVFCTVGALGAAALILINYLQKKKGETLTIASFRRRGAAARAAGEADKPKTEAQPDAADAQEGASLEETGQKGDNIAEQSDEQDAANEILLHNSADGDKA